MSTPDVSAALCKESFERFPFGVIFSKTAPDNLQAVNTDTDFCYYYFSPGLEKRCSLLRANMLTGDTNAKRDFPTDFAQYFKDDTEVMTHFKHGGSKTFCEPWSPPGVVGSIHFVYTLKTALQCESSSFMLGTFELVNDLMTGEVTAKDFDHNAHAPLPLLHHIENANKSTEIPDLWFQNAFSQLPIGMAICAADSDHIVIANTFWRTHEAKCSSAISHLKAKVSEGFDVTTGSHMISSTDAAYTVGVYGILASSHVAVQGVADASMHALAPGILAGAPDEPAAHDAHTHAAAAAHDAAPVPVLYLVYVLRPSMKNNAEPYYENGALVQVRG